MKIFETQRLIIRKLHTSDADAYYDMMGNAQVMRLIPREPMSRAASDQHLNKCIDLELNASDTKVWAIDTKKGEVFIGLCAFLKNAENQDEIGYRLREKFWKQGYGTEVTKGVLQFGFEELNKQKITADVAIDNKFSVRILEKFMTLTKTFYNLSDDCMDQRYEVNREQWQEIKQNLDIYQD